MGERSTIIVTAAVIIAMVMSCIIAGCTSQQSPESKIPTSGKQGSQTINTQTMPTPNRITTVPTLSDRNEVIIRGNDFEPGILVILNGTTVTWTNEDDLNNDYSIVSDTGVPEQFQSDTISKGGIFKFRFTKPGTYPYHSAITSEIAGKIVVL
jgi:plastocyanin